MSEMPGSEFEQIQTFWSRIPRFCAISISFLVLGHEWALILDEDEDRNLIRATELGRTLWHSIVLVQPPEYFPMGLPMRFSGHAHRAAGSSSRW